MVESFASNWDMLNTILLVIVVGAFALASLRLIKGPSYADRFVAIDMMTGLVVAISALTALATGRNEFLDVAFALALIAFVATAAFAAFLERKVQLTKREKAQSQAQTPVAGSIQEATQ
ncbi:MAG: cation transporter [Devosiaceae bacterium]|nr:cation transporter [Devosiaceae bacterium MH13]